MVSPGFVATAALLVLPALSYPAAAQETLVETLDVPAYLHLLDQAKTKSTAKEWTDAADLWEKLVKLSPLDVKHWNQLATARYNARDFSGAIAAYEKVLALGADLPSFPAYNIACCYALAGNKEAAIEWLDRSFRIGFRSLSRAQTDPDLASLHDDQRFRQIVALPQPDKMTRDEGWRSDLALLAREIKRRGYDPFRQVSGEDFDSAVTELTASIPGLTDAQVIVEMMKLVQKVGDGHSSITGAVHSTFMQALPVQFYLFKEGLYIVAADAKYRDLLGAEVLRFDNRPLANVLAALEPLISRDNDIWLSETSPYHMRYLALLHALGMISNAREVALSVRDVGGAQREIVVPAQLSLTDLWNIRPHPKGWIRLPETLAQPVPLYLKNLADHYWFEHLPEASAVYCQYNRVLNSPSENLKEFADRLFRFVDEHDVNRLIIDMRWNNGGNTLLNEAFLHRLMACTTINQRGKLFVIIGRRTFSAAQNAATLLERHTEAIFVGEPTGSSPNFIGEGITITLPYSNVFVSLSDLYWQSGWPQDRRKWIAPLLYTPPTFAAYRANRDLAMEAILDYPTGRE